MTTVKVRLLRGQSKLPAYAHVGDAGLDVCSAEKKTIFPHESALVRTGMILELPSKMEAQIRPRSGLALRHQVTVLNSPGTIDSGYRGEVGVLLVNHGSKPFVVEIGSRIAQLVIAPVVRVSVVEVARVSRTRRGTNGYGSTGR